MKIRNIRESYEDFLECEAEIYTEIYDLNKKIMSKMDKLTLVQNLKNLIDLELVDKEEAQKICIFNRKIINDFLDDIKSVNNSHEKILDLCYIRRQYHKA